MEYEWFFFSVSAAEYAGLVRNIWVCVCVCEKDHGLNRCGLYENKQKACRYTNLKTEIMCQLLYDVSTFDMSVPLHTVIHVISSWSASFITWRDYRN